MHIIGTILFSPKFTALLSDVTKSLTPVQKTENAGIAIERLQVYTHVLYDFYEYMYVYILCYTILFSAYRMYMRRLCVYIYACICYAH